MYTVRMYIMYSKSRFTISWKSLSVVEPSYGIPKK